jgi:hypothetical protein
MKHNIEQMEDFLLWLKQNYYLPVSGAGGFFAYLYYGTKKINFKDSIGVIGLAMILGAVFYNGIDFMGNSFDSLKDMPDSLKGSLSGAIGALSDPLYKMFKKIITNFLPNLLKGKLNVKEDCKIEKE